MNKHNLSIFSFNKIKIFILKLILLLGVVVGFCLHIMPQFSMEYTTSLIDKVDRLQSIEEAKIVLIGNSNLSFGIKSEMIEEAMEMPVVNMGLHGGLGNVFHERMARINVRPGDVYVLCHSEWNDDGTISDPTLAWTILENNWELWKLMMEKRDIIPMIKEYPNYLRKCIGRYSSDYVDGDEGVYSRNAFNIYGDIETVRNENAYEFSDETKAPEIGTDTISRINELSEWLTDRGAYLVVTLPPFAEGETYLCDKQEFESFQNELETRLECPVISNYADYIFDYSYFYDTNLHLTSEGAEVRTKQLIKDLEKWRQTLRN